MSMVMVLYNFLAGIIQTLQQVAFPAGRAILASLVKAEDYG